MTNFLLTNFQYQAVLNKRIKELVEQREDYQLIVNVPYSGPTTLGVIMAMTGDVGRFPNYRQYVAYSGYFAGFVLYPNMLNTRRDGGRIRWVTNHPTRHPDADGHCSIR